MEKPDKARVREAALACSKQFMDLISDDTSLESILKDITKLSKHLSSMSTEDMMLSYHGLVDLSDSYGILIVILKNELLGRAAKNPAHKRWIEEYQEMFR